MVAMVATGVIILAREIEENRFWTAISRYNEDTL
jgi:hypothetical protein